MKPQIAWAKPPEAIIHKKGILSMLYTILVILVILVLLKILGII